ncbi:hypothetical protein [Mycoplasma sp. E35C]|uniref:hypothetical protein n=1 Tax=Mycoplasma sp. E35C TaxID=2801918 RepID=UPI001CA451EE|nr:hypothetical protein [Mycoplasma sp. E35C]QZX49447.1 hypothetical protein JJE79_01730 [Mycoplasma sp. E35C]
MNDKLPNNLSKFKDHFIACLNCLDNFNFNEIKKYYQINVDRIKNSKRLTTISNQLDNPFINLDTCSNLDNFKNQLLDLINDFHNKAKNDYAFFSYSSLMMNYFCVIDLAYSQHHYGEEQELNGERKFYIELRDKIFSEYHKNESNN